MPSNRGGRAYSSQSAERMTRSGLAIAEERVHLLGKAAAGRYALRRRVEGRHAGRLRRLQDIHGLRIGDLAEAVEIMRGQTVAPQQHVGFAWREREAGHRRTHRRRARSNCRSDTAADNRRRCRHSSCSATRSASDGVRLKTIPPALPASSTAVARPAMRNAARRVGASVPLRNGCSTNRHDR